MANGRGGLLSAGGILSIVVGAFEVIGGALATLFAIGLRGFKFSRFPFFPGLPFGGFSINLTIAITVGAVLAVLGIIAIVGGISAIRRSSFGLSLAGAICALLPINVFGVLAVIFVSLAKGEFE
jgi:hypothetical protein